MKRYSIALIYIGFFGLIGFALWITKNPWCLLALIFTPSYSDNDELD